jgi:hypothetical protein
LRNACTRSLLAAFAVFVSRACRTFDGTHCMCLDNATSCFLPPCPRRCAGFTTDRTKKDVSLFFEQSWYLVCLLGSRSTALLRLHIAQMLFLGGGRVLKRSCAPS